MLLLRSQHVRRTVDENHANAPHEQSDQTGKLELFPA
jgi:hypothetical protein